MSDARFAVFIVAIVLLTMAHHYAMKAIYKWVRPQERAIRFIGVNFTATQLISWSAFVWLIWSTTLSTEEKLTLLAIVTALVGGVIIFLWRMILAHIRVRR